MFKPPRALSDGCGRGSFFDNHVKTSKMVFKFLQTRINHADFRKFFWNLNFGGSTRKSTDIAKITRKRSKPDKLGHGNGIECAKAGRMLSKSYTSPIAPIGGNPKGNDTRAKEKAHLSRGICTKRLEKEAQWL
ncbi:hypothetical protein Tco_1112342 [Tanacetum coccineum]|uniref:Uncharacterized protein n=1 Tax=Tanacetum coccineum TaxID=301880 RepID=A0ABQ5IPG3_9ASTR